MSLPTIFSGSLNAILPFNTSIEDFKRYFPDFYVSCCRTQGPGKNPVSSGAWIYHQVLKDSLKETLDKS